LISESIIISVLNSKPLLSWPKVDRPQRSASSIKVVDSTTKAVANMRKTSQNLEPIMGKGKTQERVLKYADTLPFQIEEGKRRIHKKKRWDDFQLVGIKEGRDGARR